MDRVVRDLRGASVIATRHRHEPRLLRARHRRRARPSASASTRPSCTRLSVPQLHALRHLLDRHEDRALKSTTRTAFSYDGASAPVAPATAATVKNVGLTFSLDASGSSGTRSSTLKSSAAVRRTVAMLPAGRPRRAGELLGGGAADQDRDRRRLRRGRPGQRRRLLTVAFTTNTGLTITGGTVDPDTGSAPTLLPAGVTSVVASDHRLARDRPRPDPQDRGVRRMIRRLRDDEAGSALITALLVTVVMLALGFALLSIVDTQASESATERTPRPRLQPQRERADEPGLRARAQLAGVDVGPRGRPRLLRRRRSATRSAPRPRRAPRRRASSATSTRATTRTSTAPTRARRGRSTCATTSTPTAPARSPDRPSGATPC